MARTAGSAAETVDAARETSARETSARETRDAQAATRLRLAIGRLARQLRGRQVGGLTPPQLSALSSVDRHGPVRLGDLAARERVSPPTLTPVVAALADRGLVERMHDPDDRRLTLVAITPPGRELLDAVRCAYTADLTRRIAALDADDRSALTACLSVLEHLAGTEPDTPDTQPDG